MKRIILGVLLAVGMSQAATLPYQGLATDAKGKPLADDNYLVVFSLYGAASGGSALWTETQTLATSKGLFSTSLGAVTAIPDNLFNGSALYLGVAFNGGSEGGRLLLGTTPWVKQAGSAATSTYSDSAGKVAGLQDTVAALRASLSSQSSALATKDSVGKSHIADSAKAVAGLQDSVAALRATLSSQSSALAAKDSVGKSHVADTAKFALQADSSRVAWKSDTSRVSGKADTAKVALHVIGTDSVRIYNDSVSARTARDSVQLLTSQRVADTAALNAKLRSDSVLIANQSALITSLHVFISTSSIASTNGIAWNLDGVYGQVLDSRDGQVYRTVKIGSQVWMAQNLNYAGATNDTGVCYSNSADNCGKYGRLYTWAEVMKGAASSSASPSGAKGLCPTGWHVPSDAEWTAMQKVVDSTNTTDGTKLKSKSGWNSSGNGTDTYGFRALPGGGGGGSSFYYVGDLGYWWSATEGDASFVWYRNMSYDVASVGRGNVSKTGGLSLRCAQD